MLYRLKQFYWALTHHLTLSEKAWIDHTLTSDPMRALFYSMHRADQAHAFRVATSLKFNAAYQKLPPWEKRIAAQLALLHDVGRAGQSFLIFKKVWHVLVSWIPGGRLFSPLDSHEERGAALLRDAGVIEVAELLQQPDHLVSKIVRWADDFN